MITAPPPCVPPETLGVWYQKYLDQQNPVKVQQISDQEKMKQMEREIKELKRVHSALGYVSPFEFEGVYYDKINPLGQVS